MLCLQDFSYSTSFLLTPEPEFSPPYFLQTYDVLTVKHDLSRRTQIKSMVKLDYVLTPILWVTSSGQAR